MNTHIAALREQMTREIADRQDMLKALDKLEATTAPAPTEATAARGQKPGRKPRGNKPKPIGKAKPGGRPIPPTPPLARSASSTVAAIDKLDKPDSIGGAMKYVIRQNPAAIFNTDTLLAALGADADFAPLLKDHKDKAPSQHPITGNLNYWCKTGKIRESGAGFVVNREAHGFFGIED